MKTGLKRWILCTCLCLLLAAAPVRVADAAGSESRVTVTYVAQNAAAGIETGSSGTISTGTRPVRTGDASLPMTYWGMVIISAGLIFLILLKNKKDEKEEESAF